MSQTPDLAQKPRQVQLAKALPLFLLELLFMSIANVHKFPLPA